MSRDFEIVVWGATGFTGRLVAEVLAREPDLRWAMAGRNREKLESVQRELGTDVELILADATDEASLRAMAERTTVVCTTVGPYLRYGGPLVAACVAANTHYCDLTGETPFIRRMIDAHHDDAVANGTRIVHCCGFDSIPSDIGVLMMHEAYKTRGRELAAVDAYFGETRGKASGGTAASLLGILDAARADREILKVMGDPYSLDPRPRRGGPDGPDAKGVSFEHRLGRWTAPFLMAPINTRVVRRSNAVAGYPYGESFRYTERMSLMGGVKGFAAATAVAAGLGSLLVASQIPMARRWIENKLPSPGEGPNRAQREAGYYVVRLLATAVGTDPAPLVGRVSHDLDPGYGSTSIMLAQSALCLARDPLETPGGVLTPASAMGTTLLARLRTAGLTFSVG